MNVLRPLLVLHSAKLSHIRVCGPEPQSVQAGPSLVWFPDVLPALLKSSCRRVCPSVSFPCLQPELRASVILFDLFHDDVSHECFLHLS